jgi:hypothetical protein
VTPRKKAAPPPKPRSVSIAFKRGDGDSESRTTQAVDATFSVGNVSVYLKGDTVTVVQAPKELAYDEWSFMRGNGPDQARLILDLRSV